MNESIKKIQEAMLILHKEIAVVVQNQERIDEILDGMSGTLSKLKEGKVPKGEAKLPSKPKPAAKKKHSRKKKTPEKVEEAPPKAAASNGNGASPIARSELTAHEKERILALDAEGISGIRIAKQLGRAQATVARFLRQRRENEEARA